MSAPALTFILLLFISDIVFRIYIDVVQKQLKVKMRASRVAGLAYAAYRLAALNHIPLVRHELAQVRVQACEAALVRQDEVFPVAVA